MTIEPCHQFRHLLGAYVDGQLEPTTVLGIEAHLETCEECRERASFRRAVRGSVQRSVQAEQPSDQAKARFRAAMVAEAARVRQQEEARFTPAAPMVAVAAEIVPAPNPFARASASPKANGNATNIVRVPSRAKAISSWGLRSAVPLSAAAALAVLWGASARGPFNAAAMGVNASVPVIGAADGSRMALEELAYEHSNSLPPERTDPKDVREFERFVHVPVRPRVFEKTGSGAHLVGGRMLPVHQERAAMLQYEVGTGPDAKRVSVLIYDPRRISVGSSDLAPRTVGTSEVRVGRARGYSVAVTQHDGVGYALASDLDTEHSAQFVSFVDE